MAHDTAGKQGARLENTVVSFLGDYIDLFSTITQKEQKIVRLSQDFSQVLEACKKLSGGQPFFVSHIAVLNSIYGVPWFLDFVIWHPERFPNGLIAEIKQQSVAGSVDEKYPFVVLSLKAISEQIDGPTVLFVSGGAARQCAAEWCLNQQDGKFFFIQNEAAFRHFLLHGRHKTTFSRNQKNDIPDFLR